MNNETILILAVSMSLVIVAATLAAAIVRLLHHMEQLRKMHMQQIDDSLARVERLAEMAAAGALQTTETHARERMARTEHNNGRLNQPGIYPMPEVPEVEDAGL